MQQTATHSSKEVRTATTKVQRFARQCLSRKFLLGGIGRGATKQNGELMKALKKAGDVINEEMPNQIYGAVLRGSRIKGYHTTESDVDIDFIRPSHTTDEEYQAAWDILVEVVKRHNMRVSVENYCGMPDENIDIESFSHQVDDDLHNLTIFGNAVWGNPNLLLVQMAALEIVVVGYAGNFQDWEYVRDVYNGEYLGNRDHDVLKIAQRLGVSSGIALEVLNEELYRVRYSAFTLPPPEELYPKVRRQCARMGREGLAAYDMYGVYQEVLAEL